MAGDGQTGSEQSVMNKLAMALAVALVAGAAGCGIGAVAGPGLLKPADLPAAAEQAETAPRAVAASPGTELPGAAAPSPAERLGDVVGQSVGTVCETPEGECLVGQAPINSYCECGGSAGRVVR